MSAASGYSYQSRGYAPPRTTSPASGAGAGRPMATPPQDQFSDSRNIAWQHYQELGHYLRSKNGISTRGNAKEKLTRLSKTQFQELSTDVYDELLRRKQAEVTANANQVQSFLQPQTSFHPKRNQARQKLSTLPASRFTDLASDVFIELERRFPEFAEEQDQPAPMPPSNSFQSGQNQPPQNSNLNRLGSGKRPMSPPSAEEVLGKQPSLSRPGGGGGGAQAQSSAANEVLVPNKSTLVEEDVDPQPPSPQASSVSGRGILEALESTSTTGRSHPQSFGARTSAGSSVGGNFIGRYAASSTSPPSGANFDRERQAWHAEKEEEVEKVRSDYEYRLTQLQNKLSAAQREVEEAQEERARLADRAEETAQDLKDQRRRAEEQAGQIRAYERDLAEMQEQVNASDELRHEVNDLRAQIETRARSHDASDDIISELKAEVQGLLEELRGANNRLDAMVNEREMESEKSRALESDLESYKSRYVQLQQSKQGSGAGKVESELYATATAGQEDLPFAEHGAVGESHVRAFQTSIDGLLLAGRSAEASAVLKATNDMVLAVSGLDDDVQAFENTPSIESLSDSERDQLATLKANCHATLSNLVTAARNHAGSSGLSPVSLLDAAASHLSVVIVEMVKQLKVRRSSTRFSSALLEGNSSTWPTQANYPTSAHSYGSHAQAASNSPSPMSASFSQQREASQPSRSLLSSSMRKAGPLVDNAAAVPSRTNGRPLMNGSASTTANGASSSVRHDGRSSQGSDGAAGGVTGPLRSLTRTSSNYGGDAKAQPGYSSSAASYEHNVFDSPPAGGGDNNEMDDPGSEEPMSDSYGEIKRYLDEQTEGIVRSIQALLSALRGGIQGQPLDEHLTEIITIVSSIIAMAQDHLPSESRVQGADVLREMSANRDKLVDAQDRSQGGALDKAARQAVVQASFAIARSLKQLTLLFPSPEDEEEEEDQLA